MSQESMSADPQIANSECQQARGNTLGITDI
jgi:hypothetical protein